MSKCQTCVHFEYRAGIAKSLAEAMGKPDWPSRPTCYCHHAGESWDRRSGEVKKPRGIKCSYKLRMMTCDKCGKTLKNNSDAWLVLTSKDYICKKCGEKGDG